MLKTYQALTEAQTAQPDCDTKLFFDAHDAGRTIQRVSRVGPQNLQRIVNASLTPTLLKGLGKGDAKIHIKLIGRGGVVQHCCDFGPQRKSTWLNGWIQRCAASNLEGWRQVVCDKMLMRVKSSACGHCTFLPLMSAGIDPDELKYTEVHFMGDSPLLPQDHWFDGRWIVDWNCEHHLQAMFMPCGEAMASGACCTKCSEEL